MSVKMKIMIPMLALIIFVAAGILVSNILLFSNHANETTHNEAKTASEIAMYNIDVLMTKAKSASLYLAADEGIVNAIATDDRDGLIARARQLQDESGVEFCTILDHEGTVILRTHEPDNFGDSLASQQNISAAMLGGNLTVIERGSAVRLSIRSGTSIYDKQGNIIGVVSVGFRLDTNTFADTIKELMGCEVTIYLDGESISTSVIDPDGTRTIGVEASEEIEAQVMAGDYYAGRSVISGHPAINSYTAIYGSGGQPIAMLSVGYYVDEVTAIIWMFVLIGLGITAALLLIAIIITLAVVRLITKPLQAITEAAKAISIGDIELEGLDDGTTPTHSETILLERAFSKMLDSFKKQAYILARIAEGDYTSKVEIRSEKDVINLAIELVLESTLSVLSQVATAGIQVSEGSKQIAEGAQILAQGSTEQAASVEQLSSSLSEIASKTKDNASKADRASNLAETIKQNAEKGNHQMSEMMGAVKDINQASQDIGKVIKVIDDIAFQTNILALNAAVEAARAGQHGKGFAVVAEEVRNLAAKSAEAAKDTDGLITNSIEKAELGSRIAGETASSLEEIVTGINESAQIVSDIAISSNEQSRGLEQINIGIDQVAQVVQQNSATAQESAAASEEMSGQSAMLEDLIMQFQLRSNIKDGNIMLPPKKSK